MQMGFRLLWSFSSLSHSIIYPANSCQVSLSRRQIQLYLSLHKKSSLFTIDPLGALQYDFILSFIFSQYFVTWNLCFTCTRLLSELILHHLVHICPAQCYELVKNISCPIPSFTWHLLLDVFLDMLSLNVTTPSLEPSYNIVFLFQYLIYFDIQSY